MKLTYLKIFSIAILITFLSSCAVKYLSLKNIPDDSKVLVISDTSDVLALHYSGYKFLPIQRNTADFFIDITPDWKLSNLFVNHIMSKKNISRFKLIESENHNIRPPLKETPYKFKPSSYSYPKSEPIDYKKLSDKYDVEYIFILEAKNEFDIHGYDAFYYDYEAAYRHDVYKPLNIKLKPISTLSSKFTIEMIKVNPNDKNSVKFCYGGLGTFVKKITPMNISNDFKGPFPKTEIDNFELERVYKDLKESYIHIFDKAIYKCLQDQLLYPAPDSGKQTKPLHRRR